MSDEQMPSEERLRELLLGKKVTSVRMTEDAPPSQYPEPGPTGYLTLSDGTELAVWGNDGGCGCNAGCYPLTELNAADNIITNVEVEARPDEDYEGVECRTCGKKGCWEDGHDNGGYYRIFVLAEDRRIQLASFDGTDGNGYYGTGWWLKVLA